METQDSKRKIVKETFPSEIISIIGDLLAGIILSLLILWLKLIISFFNRQKFGEFLGFKNVVFEDCQNF